MPPAPAVTVIQEEFDAAVQPQPPVVVTVTDVDCGFPSSVTLDGATTKAQAALIGSCVTVYVCPATVSVPDRPDPVVFAATPNDTEPLPVLLALLTESQLALLDAVQVHALVVVTPTAPLSPSGSAFIPDVDKV